jgi:hypothetical protein
VLCCHDYKIEEDNYKIDSGEGDNYKIDSGYKIDKFL